MSALILVTSRASHELPALPSMKLLSIEDDPSMQSALQRALGRRGIEVVACTDGALALAQWAEARPDVVVLDLSLPGMDGLEVLEQARKRGMTAPVLILTARGTVGDRIMGLNRGADDYLLKPFDLDELEARLRALSRRQPAAQGSRSRHREQEMGIEYEPSPYMLGSLRYEKRSSAICHERLALELRPRELTLLQALMVKPVPAIAKEKLFELVFSGRDRRAIRSS